MLRRIVGPFCILSLLSGACGGTATEPTRTTTSARVSLVDPVASTTLAIGTPFKISFTVEYAQDTFTLYSVAFVRDDGVYSPPFACGGGGSSGGAFAGDTVEVSGVIGPLPATGVRTDSQRFGNILYQFAKGHRVNAVLLLKRLPGPPSGSQSGCEPIATSVPGFDNPTVGTVFPAVADQRVDMSLNWFIQE
jgi:hypothetical protein